MLEFTTSVYTGYRAEHFSYLGIRKNGAYVHCATDLLFDTAA